jgi:hypothetical protein
MEDVGVFGLFYCQLVYYMVIWYIFPALVCYTKHNLATLSTQFRNFSVGETGQGKS